MAERNTSLLRRLKIAEIVLLILLIISTVVIILNYTILPSYGINVSASTTGDSMYPAIQEGALIVWYDESRAPFKDVQAGDIIIFREREDAYILTGSETATIRFRKGSIDGNDNSNNSSDAEAISIAPNTEEKTEPEYHDSGIVYLDGKVIMHRAAEIIEGTNTSDRAIITAGDGNGYNDQAVVMKSGYVGTTVWHKNYIGWPYRILTFYKGFVWLIGVAVVLGIAIFFLRRRSQHGSGQNS